MSPQNLLEIIPADLLHPITAVAESASSNPTWYYHYVIVFFCENAPNRNDAVI